MIKKCNFRTHGIYGIPPHDEKDPKLYCAIKTHTTGLSRDGKTVGAYVRLNSLCDDEDNCVLFLLYDFYFGVKQTLEHRIIRAKRQFEKALKEQKGTSADNFNEQNKYMGENCCSQSPHGMHIVDVVLVPEGFCIYCRKKIP